MDADKLGVEYRNEEDQGLPSKCLHSVVGEGQLWTQKRGIDKNYKENTKGKVLVMGGLEKDSKTVSFEDGWDFDKQVEGRCLGEAVPHQAGPEPS